MKGILIGVWILGLILHAEADLVAWRAQHFPDAISDPGKEATVWGDLANPDEDAYVNLLEYALATDPNRHTDPLLGSVSELQGRQAFSLTFPYHTTEPHLAYIVDWSSDATQWSQGTILAPSLDVPITPRTSLVDRSPQGVTVRSNQSLEENPRQFMRLRIVAEDQVLPALAPAQPFLIQDGLLTDPILQHPASDSVQVVWYTAFEGSGHQLIYGEALDQASPAQTSKLTRMLEDDRSELLSGVANQLGSATASGVRERSIWRHEAIALGLTPGLRYPYFVESLDENADRYRSQVHSLQARPDTGQGVRILLTSDQQNRSMSAANYQKVSEAIGPVDAIFFAGDFVDYPNRASEWFDRDNDERPAFFPAMQGRYDQLAPAHPYGGGPLLQHAALFGVLGNHEVTGRWLPSQNDIETMFNDPQPHWYAEIAYRDHLAAGSAADPTYVRDHSSETITYDEMWPSSNPGLPYWSYQYGDVFVIGLHVNRIWRLWGANRKGKEGEDPSSVNDPTEWGFGDHLFEPFGLGSAQYQWLETTLASSAFQNAKYRMVMAHQSMFGLGDNVYPVLATQDAEIRYDVGNGPESLSISHPISLSDWDTHIAPLLGSITAINYHYDLETDIWKNEIEPLLTGAGVHLVLSGHSHLWNRSKIGTMNYLETSNVGNSFGARYDDESGSPSWPPTAFPAGDPHGRPMIAPNLFNPMQALEGYENPLPFVSSNRLTVFSILDTSDGTVKSYVFDTENPSSAVIPMDAFALRTP